MFFDLALSKSHFWKRDGKYVVQKTIFPRSAKRFWWNICYFNLKLGRYPQSWEKMYLIKDKVASNQSLITFSFKTEWVNVSKYKGLLK